MLKMNQQQPKQSYSVKRKFSDREDQIILSMVDRLGIHSWNRIAEALISRTPRQCRERWRHYLKPVIKSTSWTTDEDSVLESKYNDLGPKWSLIAPYLPGRTEVNVKNRWTRLCRLKRKQKRLLHKQKLEIQMKSTSLASSDTLAHTTASRYTIPVIQQLKDEDGQVDEEEDDDSYEIRSKGEIDSPSSHINTKFLPSIMNLIKNDTPAILSVSSFLNEIMKDRNSTKEMKKFVEMAVVHT